MQPQMPRRERQGKNDSSRHNEHESPRGPSAGMLTAIILGGILVVGAVGAIVVVLVIRGGQNASMSGDLISGSGATERLTSDHTRKEIKAQPTDWNVVERMATVGDMTVTLASAHNEDTSTWSYVNGQFQNCGPFLQVALKMRNGSPTRNFRFSGWSAGELSLSDEHGNTYRMIDIRNGQRLYDQFGSAYVEAALPIAGLINAESERTITLYFEPLPAAAKIVQLAIDGRALGSDSPIRLKAPRVDKAP